MDKQLAAKIFFCSLLSLVFSTERTIMMLFKEEAQTALFKDPVRTAQ